MRESRRPVSDLSGKSTIMERKREGVARGGKEGEKVRGRDIISRMNMKMRPNNEEINA